MEKKDAIIENPASAPSPAAGLRGNPLFRRLLDEAAAAARQRDRERLSPAPLVDDIRTLRLGSLRVPRALGGWGATVEELLVIVIELAQADSNLAHILRNHFTFVERLLRRPAQEFEGRWLQEVVAGRLFGLASTEIQTHKVGQGLGTTRLKPGDGRFLLEGVKHYSTGSLFADWIVVRAVAGEEGATVVVPAGAPGLELRDDWDGIGQRLSGSGSTVFHDVYVPAGNVQLDSQTLRGTFPYRSTFPQLFLTAAVAGILKAILRDARELVKSRQRSFYHAPAERPEDDILLQQIVGDISTRAFVAEAAVLAAARDLDAAAWSAVDGVPDEEQALQAALSACKAKIFVDQAGLDAGAALFDVGGASATREALALDRHWRNIRTLASHNPRIYKSTAVGNYEINDVRLPVGSFF